ncbi:MAG: adenylate kinase [Verrucomicrobia bacterium]|nr:adenylate kinase [Verrucomicrobiota bacterium]
MFAKFGGVATAPVAEHAQEAPEAKRDEPMARARGRQHTMNIALIGPSGAGKGTHITRLVDQFALAHVATGDLFRVNLERHTALGLLARKYMAQGELVPDEVVDAMIEEWLHAVPAGRGTLFDGFPRTRPQARFLDDLLGSGGRLLEAAIYLKVDDETMVRRLAGRLVCRQCHAPFHELFRPPVRAGQCDHCGGELQRWEDDQPELVRKRLRVFHRAAGLMIDYYQQTGRLLIIDGDRPVEAVARALSEALTAVTRQALPAATPQEADQLRARGPVVPELRPEQAVHPSLDLVLLGGPGTGKGTHAERLGRQMNLPHIATGDLFRENLQQQTDLGKLAKRYMDRGELVPDDVTESMVQERLERPDVHDGFILDGFPRTLPQGAALTEMLTHLRRRLAGVVSIRLSDAEILERLSGRLICRACQAPYHVKFNPPKTAGHCDVCGGEVYRREDDNPETVRARLKTFHRQTEPLSDYYRQAGLLHEVSGSGSVAEVATRIDAIVRELARLRAAVPKGGSP